LRLIPELIIATISEFAAIREVKKTTAINVNNALNMFKKKGIKFT
jgi:hypothetical protein